MRMDRRAKQELQGRVVDSSSVIFVAFFFYNHPKWFNPWGFSALQWVVGGILIRGAIAFYDHLVVAIIEWCSAELLPTRTTGKAVRYVSLDVKSFFFLSINSVHEWIFVQRLCHYIWYSPDVSKDFSEVGAVNTIVSLYVMFVVLDVIYAPCHHILHMPKLYPLIHKHHHRQHFPTRGYLDAGNEHPVEHVIGVSCTWAAVITAVHTTGAHATTIFIFFNIHAALAMLNHSPYNVEWNVLGLKYSVGNHEMHHRMFTVNYAQYCMWYDYVAGTFTYYEGPKKKLT